MSNEPENDLPDERDPTTMFGDPARWRSDIKMILSQLSAGNFDIPGRSLERMGQVLESIAMKPSHNRKDRSIVINASRVIVKLADHNLDRLKTHAAIAMKMIGVDDETATDSTKIIVIEDEGWYGNNAHTTTPETPALPASDFKKPGPV